MHDEFFNRTQNSFADDNSTKLITKKVKKTEDIKTYHKEYKKNNEGWKEYLSAYVEKNKDKLNERKRIDRKVKNDLFTLIKTLVENNMISFKNDEDFKTVKSLVFFKNN